MAVVVQVGTGPDALLFETEATSLDLAEIGLNDKVEDLVKGTVATAEGIVATVRECARQVTAVIDDLTTDVGKGGSLSGAHMSVGVTISAAGNVIVAKGSAEANLVVSLDWDFT
jgi:hypothetical protein